MTIGVEYWKNCKETIKGKWIYLNNCLPISVDSCKVGKVYHNNKHGLSLQLACLDPIPAAILSQSLSS